MEHKKKTERNEQPRNTTSRHSLLSYYVTLNLKKTIRESSTAAAPSPRVRTGRPPTECLPYGTAVRPVRYPVCDHGTSGHTSHVCVAADAVAAALSPRPRLASDVSSVRRHYNNRPLLGLIILVIVHRSLGYNEEYPEQIKTRNIH